jgi:hypothetical protein
VAWGRGWYEEIRNCASLRIETSNQSGVEGQDEEAAAALGLTIWSSLLPRPDQLVEA